MRLPKSLSSYVELSKLTAPLINREKSDYGMTSKILTAVLLYCLCISTQAEDSEDIEKILQLYKDYLVAVESSDLEGYLDVLHPEIRLLPPGAPTIAGAENYAEFLVPVFDTAVYRIDVESDYLVEVVDDIATSEYIYTVHLTLKDPSVGVTQEGALTAQRTRSRYFDVLRKKPDGEWAIWRHTWTELGD